MNTDVRAAEARLAQLYIELRTWTAYRDDYFQAAVELLIQHDYWLRNGRFVRAAVVSASDGRYILWSKAREAFDAGEFDRSSTTELAVLDLAIALALDRFKLSHMGTVNSRLVTRAFALAAGVLEVAARPQNVAALTQRATPGAMGWEQED